jgi:hypothetical protein
MSDAGCCAVDPRTQTHQIEPRTFVTYMPVWRPAKSRKHLLQQPGLHAHAGYAARSVLGLVDFTDKLDSLDRRRLAFLIVAYAREGGKYAFEFSNRVWQEENARLMCEEIDKQLNKVTQNVGDRASASSVRFIGMQPSTRHLQFQWMAVQVTIDIGFLFEYITGHTRSATAFYERRWKDKRYGCITRARCPVPSNLVRFKKASDVEYGLAFDYVVSSTISKWSLRRVFPSDIISMEYLSDLHSIGAPHTLLASAPLRKLWQRNDPKLIELEKQARAAALMYYPNEIYDDALLLSTCKPPGPMYTVMSGIDQLIEETMNETRS